MTAAESRPRVHRADHCGSLLRPPELRHARLERALGRMSDDALRAMEDRAILAVLDLQQSVGLTIYSDGEFRRKFFHEAMETAFAGVVEGGPDYDRFPNMRKADLDSNPELATINPIVTERLRPKGRISAHEAGFLKRHAPGEFKITLPSPAMVTRKWLSTPAGRAAYPRYEDLLQDVAKIMAAEAKALAAEGVTYIQLDAPAYTRFMLRDKVEEMRRDGIDAAQDFAAVMAAENVILRAAKQPGVTVAVHICHGTYFLDGRGAAGGGAVNYDPELTQQLYHGLDAGVFLVEYTERGGGAESLRGAPKDKIFSLGLLNVRDPQLESPDNILRKIEAASRYVAPENLSLSPNCGFSGAAAGAWMSPDEQKRKLDLLVDTAEKIWGEA